MYSCSNEIGHKLARQAPLVQKQVSVCESIHFFYAIIYSMIEKYYFEFSKIYCRLMRLEIQIKRMLISSLLSYYKDDIIQTFYKFLHNKDRLKRYSSQKGNAILAILKNPQTSNPHKFKNIINKLYLSDLLFIVLYCEQFQKAEITNNFYFKVPEKFGTLISARQLLLDLRNTIAHYNFKNYEQNKYDYLEALLAFEIHMGKNIKGILEFPKFNEKPSIKTILLSIKQLRPDLLDIDWYKDDEMEYFYNKHRVLMDLCDEIALYNGYESKDLPSPWTILRQMYTIKQGDKTADTKELSDYHSLPLFKQN